jgi:hypothetical protein
MTDSPNLLHRKTTTERNFALPRRSSEIQASPFRYNYRNQVFKTVKCEAATPLCSHSSKSAKFLALKST